MAKAKTTAIEAASRIMPRKVLPSKDMRLGEKIWPNRAYKLCNIIENFNLGCMFNGMRSALEEDGLTFSAFGAGETLMFINRKRNYIKLLVGNGTEYPVIAAYRIPEGEIPREALLAIAEAFLRRGDIQMDARLASAVGDGLKEYKRA